MPSLHYYCCCWDAPTPFPDPCPLTFCAETAYVLGNYKTEPCKKPPRLCRQGYACPYYHNSKDRRRSPRKHKYRSSGPRRPSVGGRSCREGVMTETATTMVLKEAGSQAPGFTGPSYKRRGYEGLLSGGSPLLFSREAHPLLILQGVCAGVGPGQCGKCGMAVACLLGCQRFTAWLKGTKLSLVPWPAGPEEQPDVVP